jgi:hypothetical protein
VSLSHVHITSHIKFWNLCFCFFSWCLWPKFCVVTLFVYHHLDFSFPETSDFIPCFRIYKCYELDFCHFTENIEVLLLYKWILSRNFSDYRRVLDWWSDLLDTLIQRVTTLYSPLLHMHTCIHSHIFTSRCLVAASNRGRSPSSGFPVCLTATAHHGWTATVLSPTNQPINRLSEIVLPITSRHGPRRKHRSSVAVYGPLRSNGRCIFAYFTVVA